MFAPYAERFKGFILYGFLLSNVNIFIQHIELKHIIYWIEINVQQNYNRLYKK